MFKKILLITSLVLPTIVLAEEVKIDSPVLQSLPSQELGQVILKFIPSASGTINWYTNANDTTFRWIDRKYIEITLDDGTVTSSRRAVYRGNVNGVKSTYLDNHVYEMPWLLTLQGDSLGKFGVDSVLFEPYIIGIHSQDETTCFGSTHENCDFKPFNSLKKLVSHLRKSAKTKWDQVISILSIFCLRVVKRTPTAFGPNHWVQVVAPILLL